MELELEVDAIAGVLVVTAHGELVESALGPLRECLQRAVAGGRPVVLDLLGVASIDVAGVRLLVEAHQRFGKRVRIVGERDGVVHARLQDCGIAHVLALERSRATALASSVPLASASAT